MRKISLPDHYLLNGFSGCMLALLAALFIWLSFGWTDLANGYESRPELIPDAYFSQAKYDKLREVAVSCYKLQDDIHVASLRGTAKYSMNAALILAGLCALFFLNAWAFRRIVRGDELRSNP